MSNHQDEQGDVYLDSADHINSIQQHHQDGGQINSIHSSGSDVTPRRTSSVSSEGNQHKPHTLASDLRYDDSENNKHLSKNNSENQYEQQNQQINNNEHHQVENTTIQVIVNQNEQKLPNPTNEQHHSQTQHKQQQIKYTNQNYNNENDNENENENENRDNHFDIRSNNQNIDISQNEKKYQLSQEAENGVKLENIQLKSAIEQTNEKNQNQYQQKEIISSKQNYNTPLNNIENQQQQQTQSMIQQKNNENQKHLKTPNQNIDLEPQILDQFHVKNSQKDTEAQNQNPQKLEQKIEKSPDVNYSNLPEPSFGTTAKPTEEKQLPVKSSKRKEKADIKDSSVCTCLLF